MSPCFYSWAKSITSGIEGPGEDLTKNFEDSHINQLISPYGWTLIGKFSQGFNKSDPKQGRPSVEDLQKYFLSLDFRSDFNVGLLDNRHLLIKLNCE